MKTLIKVLIIVAVLVWSYIAGIMVARADAGTYHIVAQVKVRELDGLTHPISDEAARDLECWSFKWQYPDDPIADRVIVAKVRHVWFMLITDDHADAVWCEPGLNDYAPVWYEDHDHGTYRSPATLILSVVGVTTMGVQDAGEMKGIPLDVSACGIIPGNGIDTLCVVLYPYPDNTAVETGTQWFVNIPTWIDHWNVITWQEVEYGYSVHLPIQIGGR